MADQSQIQQKLVVHHRNSKGQITHADEYRMVCEGSEVKYERPPGSGIWYHGDWTPVKKASPAVAAPAKPATAIDEAIAESDDLGIPSADALVAKAKADFDPAAVALAHHHKHARKDK